MITYILRPFAFVGSEHSVCRRSLSPKCMSASISQFKILKINLHKKNNNQSNLMKLVILA